MGGAFIAKLKQLYASAQELIEERALERFHDGSVSRAHNLAHLSVMAVKSFLRNKCPVRATALSYTTLLALVPLLAVGVSVTSSFLQEKGEDATKKLIEEFVQAAAPQLDLFAKANAKADDGKTADAKAPDVRAADAKPADAQPADPKLADLSKMADAKRVGDEPAETEPAEVEPADAYKQVVDRIFEFVGNFRTKTVGYTGLFGMIVVALLLMSTIEGTFNDIWGVRRRAWFQRLVTYWTTISLGPMVIVMAFVLAQNSKFSGSILFDILPFIVISLGFGLLYKLMPNTHVQWRAALTAGVVGGCLWLLLNLLNAASLGRVVQMSKIYGSLAIIPIFLIGLYFSWLIVLFGAQVSYTIQNRRIYLQERRAVAVSQTGREFMALRVMTRVAQRFAAGAPRPSVSDLSEHLGVSSRLVTLVLEPLLESHLLAEVADEDATYIPGRPLENITCHDILAALRTGDSPACDASEGREAELVLDAFNRIQNSEKKIASGINFKELTESLEGTDKIRRLQKELAP